MSLDNKQLHFPSLQPLWSKDLKQLDKREYINPQIPIWSSYTLSFSTQPQKGFAASRRSPGKSMVMLGTKYLFPSLEHQSQAEIKPRSFPPLFHENSSTPKRFPDIGMMCPPSYICTFPTTKFNIQPKPVSMWWWQRFNSPVDPWPIWHRASFNNSLSSWPHYKNTKIPSA